MSDHRSPINPLAPYPSLAERDAGDLPEPEMHEGVPSHMEEPLLAWTKRALRHRSDVARSVLARCRVTWSEDHILNIYTPADVLARLITGKASQTIRAARRMDQLDYLDALVHLNPDWNDGGSIRQAWIEELVDLELLLRDCGSAWYIEGEFRGLYRRVDDTVMEAWRDARTAAEKAGRASASQNLAEAWRSVYGISPQPTEGYSYAVKAVEAVVCPLVVPGWKSPTVHKARTELSKNSNQWRFVLVENEDVEAGHGSIDVVVAMLDRLLRGETGRHALEGRNRPSTQAEAEAALHLAAVLVQWFSRGAIQRRE